MLQRRCINELKKALTSEDAPAALRLVLDRGFGQHGAHRMWLDAIGGNERARHVYEKIGFTYEGEWREAWQTAEGAWLPMIFLGMLDREWAEIRAAS